MPRIIEFHTERLRLRQWQTQDWDAFAAMNADPQVMAYFPNLLDREASDDMANRIYAELTQRGWGLWAVEIPGEAPFIGFVGLHIPCFDIPCEAGIEIGWRLAHPYWGKGYATEAAGAALAIGFTQLQLPEIVSFAALENSRSRAVMERLGMRCADEYFDHPLLAEDHPLRKHALYRIRREEWLRCQEQRYAAR
jgi:RimJ/RimL family protein N-acetyltransferase